MNSTRRFPGAVILCALFSFSAVTNVSKADGRNSVLPYEAEVRDHTEKSIRRICGRNNGSILLLSGDGSSVISISPEVPRSPASVLKIATALFALETLGPEFRFETTFFLSSDKVLTVRACGDPFLVSEEWALIADSLSARLDAISEIRLDDTAFARGLTIPGVGESGRPYDACFNAFCTNFNTCAVTVCGPEVYSAEEQTPLTESVRRLALSEGRRGTFRFSLDTVEQVHIYTGQLLTTFLEARGVVFSRAGAFSAPEGRGAVLYTHRSSRKLESVVESMLMYSNNLVANHLLFAAAEPVSGRVDLEKATTAVNSFIALHTGIDGFSITEGSGISRKNRLTAAQVVVLLESFSRYRELLPVPERYKNEKTNKPSVRLKTGTMEGIETAAGYILPYNGSREYRFAVLLEGAPPGSRDRIVDHLVRLVTGGGVEQ